MSLNTLTKETYDKNWSPYKLDYMGYMVFQALQQNPTETLSRISDMLGVSITVVKSRLTRLKEIGFLRSDSTVVVPFLGRRTQTEVEAVYNPEALGLSRFHIIIYGLRDQQAFKDVDSLLAVHPYTHYSAGSFTNGSDMYCQFDIPRDSKKLVKKVLRELQDQDLFENYTIFIPDNRASNIMDFTYWDIQQRQWMQHQYEGDQIIIDSELEDHFHDAVSSSKDGLVTIPISELNEFDHVDMKLIRELTVNSKVSTVELARHYDLDQSTISRRLSKIKEIVIDRNILFFDESTFNLEYPTLFYGNFDKSSRLDEYSFLSLVQDTDLPFSSSLATNKNKFIWMVTLPTRKIIEYSKFFWNHTRKFQVFNLDLKTSRRYYFMHTNYVDDGHWNISEEYVIDQPLELLE